MALPIVAARADVNHHRPGCWNSTVSEEARASLAFGIDCSASVAGIPTWGNIAPPEFLSHRARGNVSVLQEASWLNGCLTSSQEITGRCFVKDKLFVRSRIFDASSIANFECRCQDETDSAFDEKTTG